MKKIIFGSGNKGKIREVKKLFQGTNIKIISLYELGDIPEIVEDADTFEGNAKLKAEAIFQLYGVPVIADDSGLVVEQLDGEPGIYSARFAGENVTYEDNNKKLLKKLSEFPKPHKAKFVCSAVYYDGEKYLNAFGELEGEIIDEYCGNNGFGYDPLFKPEGFQLTLAQMSLEAKNGISHRARAFGSLKEKLSVFVQVKLEPGWNKGE